MPGRSRTGTVSILIADDSACVAVSALLLETQPKWKVVGEKNNSGRDAVEKATALRPDVRSSIISMPGLNGLDAASLIFKAAPKHVSTLADLLFG